MEKRPLARLLWAAAILMFHRLAYGDPETVHLQAPSGHTRSDAVLAPSLPGDTPPRSLKSNPGPPSAAVRVQESLTLPLPAVHPPPVPPVDPWPLRFVRNEGQIDAGIQFEVQGRGFTLSLQQCAIVLWVPARPKPDAEGDGAKGKLGGPSSRLGEQAVVELAPVHPIPQEYDHHSPRPHLSARGGFHALRMSLVGAYPDAAVTGEDELEGRHHYLLGNDPTRWHTHVPAFAKVRYHQAYPGIDLVYYGKDGQLEYDFVVAPGADPGRIEMAIDGADTVDVDPQGDLRIMVANRELRWLKPRVYQEIDGGRMEVASEYLVRASSETKAAGRTHRVGFRLAPYERHLALVIDPILAYSTYLGGSFADSVRGVATDKEGNVYLTGTTTSSTAYSSRFPTTTNALQTRFSGNSAAFVTKLDPQGKQMIYSTVLSGTTAAFTEDFSGAVGGAIAVDRFGNAVIAGTTGDGDFPTRDPFQPSHGGGRADMFVAKLNADGSALHFASYLGGSDWEGAPRLALDAADCVYIASNSNSQDFPLVNALDTTPVTTGPVLSKLAADGSRLNYSTRLTPLGTGSYQQVALAVDPDGHAWIAGNTVQYPPGASHAEYSDAFLLRLSPGGSGLKLAKTDVLGGPVSVGAIARGPDSSVFLAGSTYSASLPTTQGVVQSRPGGAPPGISYENWDGFVAKVDTSNSTLEYLTYLGGSSRDNICCLVSDSQGEAYVAGSTASRDFPIAEALQTKLNAGLSAETEDAFLLRLAADGRHLLWSTYLGGGRGSSAGTAGQDIPYALAVGPENAVYLAGWTDSLDFPVANPLQASLKRQPPYAASDAFIAKIVDAPSSPPVVQITRSGDVVTLSWPIAATGFDLEAAHDATNLSGWAKVSAPRTTVGDRNVASVEIGTAPQFFRLKKP